MRGGASLPWLSAFWGCALAVLVLALVPTVPELPTTGWDKSNHVLAFGVLALLGGRAYPRQDALLLPGLLLYGGLIEVLQAFTPYRLAEWSDFAADAVGIALAAGIRAGPGALRRMRASQRRA